MPARALADKAPVAPDNQTYRDRLYVTFPVAIQFFTFTRRVAASITARKAPVWSGVVPD